MSGPFLGLARGGIGPSRMAWVALAVIAAGLVLFLGIAIGVVAR